ncbi:MAG: hypothetical protein AB1736_04830 [Chloroflexota bacterium]
MTKHARIRFRIAVLVALAVVAGGCSEPPITKPASPQNSPGATLPVPQEELESWLQFRRVYGLRTDLEWVLEVASDPKASVLFEVPLLPFELDQVANANSTAQRLVSPARGYGTQFPDEFAGAWIEGSMVVLAFTDELDVHRIAVAALFGQKINVRQARYTLRELEALAATVKSNSQWFQTVGADLVSADVNELLNAVEVQYRAPDTAVEPVIRARFRDAGWMYLTYAGPGPWTGPVGDLELTVVDRDGQPVEVECLLRTLDPRVAGEHLPQVVPDGRCGDTDLPAVEWLVDVTYTRDDVETTITTKLVVPPGGVARSTLAIDQ